MYSGEIKEHKVFFKNGLRIAVGRLVKAVELIFGKRQTKLSFPQMAVESLQNVELFLGNMPKNKIKNSVFCNLTAPLNLKKNNC